MFVKDSNKEQWMPINVGKFADNTVCHESFTEVKFRGFSGFLGIRKIFSTNYFEYGGTSIKFTSSVKLFSYNFS